MDIQVASNFERLYFEGVQRNGQETGRAFRAFAGTGELDIPPGALSSMRQLFAGAATSEDETARTILATLNETGRLIDPHTAVAVSAAHRSGADPSVPTIVLSTAHAAKFPEAVSAATGVTPQLPGGRTGLSQKPERFDRLPAEAEAIKAYVRAFAAP
jgi:threonine synthase